MNRPTHRRKAESAKQSLKSRLKKIARSQNGHMLILSLPLLQIVSDYVVDWLT